MALLLHTAAIITQLAVSVWLESNYFNSRRYQEEDFAQIMRSTAWSSSALWHLEPPTYLLTCFSTILPLLFSISFYTLNLQKQ